MKEFEEELKEDVMAAKSHIRGYLNESVDFESEGGLVQAYNNYKNVVSLAVSIVSSLEALIWINKIKKKATA